MTTSRRRWFRLSLKTLLVVVALCCCGLAWIVRARGQSRQRDETFILLGPATNSFQVTLPERSLDWSFRNVRSLTKIELKDGMYTDDDVRRLRRVFPGLRVYHVHGYPREHFLNPVVLREDEAAAQADRQE